MVVLTTQSEFGHAPPPQTPYSIISNLPGWELGKSIRDGDTAPLAKLVHIYPRFAPTQFTAQLGGAIAKLLGMEERGAFLYLHPDMWPYTLRHITNAHREDKVMKAEDVALRCVDVAGHRLYVVLYDRRQTPGVMVSWGNPGLGLSIRGAELLLEGVGDMKEVDVKGIEGVPEPTWTPESSAHQGLKERIVELLHRAPGDPKKVKVRPNDVFLYPTGMAAIFHTSNFLLEYRPGSIVVAGIVFHNTYHHLLEECPHGWKFAGRVDAQGLDELEAWLEGERDAGRLVSYLFIEFPGNPTLESSDLKRLKGLSEKYGFVLIVDDTIGGFGNIDVLPFCDILITSLTKSFSALANVMGGSVVLNPLSPHYTELSSLWAGKYRNEFFAADAEVLLANSREFLPRTQIFNRNAQAVATFLQDYASQPGSPISRVLYPSLLPSKSIYDTYKTTPTPDLPEPGYGCLLSVDFDTIDAAKTFYDHCGFYPSPHLGGHVTIMFAYNMFVFGKEPEEREAFRQLGVREECVRISVGLEDVEDLIDTLKDALKTVELSRQ